MLARVYSGAVQGVDGLLIEVEVDISRGLPVFTTVGLPDGAVRESKERVKAAIKNCDYEFPVRRITVNLAPADVKKEGTGFDLPIALGILVASGMLESSYIDQYCVVGELSLDGSLRRIPGVLPMTMAAKKEGFKGIIVPKPNEIEASVVRGIEVLGVNDLTEVVDFFAGEIELVPTKSSFDDEHIFSKTYQVDFDEVKGQEHVKRALEIAASGGHNVLLKGPPGSGKTMLSRRLPTIIPDLSFKETLETTKIYSIMGMLPEGHPIRTTRPFRAPHHTVSDAGLIGGGRYPRPGEVSLAHNGVLFLDELAEFKKHVLEVLRQPMEDGVVTISRANQSLSFPARFMLVVALNPCPCGYYGDEKHDCDCNSTQIQRYMSRVSGPLLDRIDLHLEVAALPFKDMTGRAGESLATIKKRVEKTRKTQLQRFKNRKSIYCNGQMGTRDLDKFCKLDKKSTDLLSRSVDKLGLSARAYHRILKIARTIADMENSNDIQFGHIAEAVQYRR